MLDKFFAAARLKTNAKIIPIKVVSTASARLTKRADSNSKNEYIPDGPGEKNILSAYLNKSKNAVLIPDFGNLNVNIVKTVTAARKSKTILIMNLCFENVRNLILSDFFILMTALSYLK